MELRWQNLSIRLQYTITCRFITCGIYGGLRAQQTGRHMRIGTWNVENRLITEEHRDLLLAQNCDVWLGSSPILVGSFENAVDSVSFWDERINH
jgi:hypothetical protein